MSLYAKYGMNPFEMFRRRRERMAKQIADESRMSLSPQVGLAIFSGIALVGVSVGATIGTYVFFGTVTLVGLIALIEANPRLRWFAKRSSRGIDVLIFAGSIYAAAQLGVTTAAALTFAGLGYTLVYSPMLRMK